MFKTYGYSSAGILPQIFESVTYYDWTSSVNGSSFVILLLAHGWHWIFLNKKNHFQLLVSNTECLQRFAFSVDLRMFLNKFHLKLESKTVCIWETYTAVMSFWELALLWITCNVMLSKVKNLNEISNTTVWSRHIFWT